MKLLSCGGRPEDLKADSALCRASWSFSEWCRGLLRHFQLGVTYDYSVVLMIFYAALGTNLTGWKQSEIPLTITICR
jgi:hypothetical protein